MEQAEPLKFVFMGTPELAATVLRAVLARVAERGDAQVVGVYCQPDKPAGRGLALTPPPVKLLAQEYALPVFQPKNFKTPEDVRTLANLAPDYLLVAAYGLILPQSVLDIPRKKPLNVHTSLLPLYRGAAPIQRAIMDGRTETGVSIMVMEAGLDTGPIVVQDRIAIKTNETAGSLHDNLALFGGSLLLHAIDGLENGTLVPRRQNDTQATYAAKLAKNDGRLDFTRSVHTIHAQARGVTPWPGAFGLFDRGDAPPLQVAFFEGEPCAMPCPPEYQPGDILPHLVQGALGVACPDGVYRIAALRPAGKKRMDAAGFVNGYMKNRGAARFLPALE